MTPGFYWVRWKGSVEGSSPIVVCVTGLFDYVDVPGYGEDYNFFISEFEFFSKEPLTPPEAQ